MKKEQFGVNVLRPFAGAEPERKTRRIPPKGPLPDTKILENHLEAQLAKLMVDIGRKMGERDKIRARLDKIRRGRSG